MKRNSLLAFASWMAVSVFLNSSCAPQETAVDAVEVSGVIECIKTDVRSRAAGDVKDIRVREGQTVREGDLLCFIDDPYASFQLKQIQAGIEGARAKLRLFRKGSKKELVAVAQNWLETATKEYETVLRTQERMTKLFREGAIPEDQKEKADLKMKAALDRYESASENLKLVARGREAEEIDIVRAEIKRLQIQAQSALQRIEDSRISAPACGYVETKFIENGEYVRPGSLLFSIIDPGKTYVKAYIPEKYLGKILLHSPVLVKCDSYPGRQFKGQIDFISSQAEFSPKNVQTKEERLKLVFMMKSYLENKGLLLKPGMPVDVTLPLGSTEKRKERTDF